jgi:PIN domain nuclease of toxin-antitoxin system
MALLDTCTLLWIASGAPELSARGKDEIARHAGAVFVSAITALEIGIKVRRGKIALPKAPGAWYEAVLDFHGIREIPVTGRLAAASTRLPALHPDPCDRIIVATALEHGLIVITPDPLIHAYPGLEFVW